MLGVTSGLEGRNFSAWKADFFFLKLMCCFCFIFNLVFQVIHATMWLVTTAKENITYWSKGPNWPMTEALSVKPSRLLPDLDLLDSQFWVSVTYTSKQANRRIDICALRHKQVLCFTFCFSFLIETFFAQVQIDGLMDEPTDSQTNQYIL